MAKRSRRERRAAQMTRALQGGDAAAIAVLAEQAPVRAAEALQRAFEARGGDEAFVVTLLPLVEKVVASLRRRNELSRALELLCAAGRRTARLRLEEALAAFAAGDDARAAEVAALDDRVARHVTPLLEALRGVSPRARASSGGVQSAQLQALTHVVAASVRGDVRQAYRVLGAARRAWPHVANALGAAVELCARGAREGGVRGRLGPAAVAAAAPSVPAVRRAFAAEWVAAFPHERLDILRRALGPDDAGLREAGRSFLARELASASGGQRGAMATLIAQVGARSVDEGEHGTAYVYEAFGAMGHDSERALGAFDRALRTGAPRDEVLRGKLVLALRSQSDAAEVGRAADALLESLRAQRASAPLAYVAALEGGRAWLAAGQSARARAAASFARAAGSVPGRLGDELDHLEAQALAKAGHATAALTLLERTTARNPAFVDAWHARIQTARATGLAERRVGELIAEAAVASGDGRLKAELRRWRLQYDGLEPFSDLEPGQAGAGTLAAELALMYELGGVRRALALPPPAGMCRAALAADARLAFDAAHLALVTRSKGADPALLLAMLAIDRTSSPAEVADLAAVALLFEEPLAVYDLCAKLAPHAPYAAAAVVEACALGPYAGLARDALRRVSRKLEPRERRRMQGVVRAAVRGLRFASGSPEKVARRLDALLAPDFSLLSLRAGAQRAASSSGGEAAGGAMSCPLLRDFLETLGVSPGDFAQLEPSERDKAHDLVHELARTRDEKLMTRLLLLLMPALPPEGFEPPPRRRRRTNKQRFFEQ